MLHTRALLLPRGGGCLGRVQIHRYHAASSKAAKVIVPPGMPMPEHMWRKCETVPSFHQKPNLRCMRPNVLLSGVPVGAPEAWRQGAAHEEELPRVYSAIATGEHGRYSSAWGQRQCSW